MKRHRPTSEQVVRKLAEGARILTGTTLTYTGPGRLRGVVQSRSLPECFSFLPAPIRKKPPGGHPGGRPRIPRWIEEGRSGGPCDGSRCSRACRNWWS